MKKIEQSTITENISLWEGVFLEFWICQDITLYLLGLIGLKVHWILKTMEMPSYLLTSFINCQVLRLYIKIKSN